MKRIVKIASQKKGETDSYEHENPSNTKYAIDMFASGKDRMKHLIDKYEIQIGKSIFARKDAK